MPSLRMPRTVGTTAVSPHSFKALFCQYFACPAHQYEQQLFSRFLHRHALPLANLLAKCDPDFFREDWGLIRDLATAQTHGEVLTELNRFYGRNVRDRNWFRKRLSLRISGKRVLRLSRKLFRIARQAS